MDYKQRNNGVQYASIEETVKLVQAAGGTCYGYVCDLCNREDIYKKAALLKEEVGKGIKRKIISFVQSILVIPFVLYYVGIFDGDIGNVVGMTLVRCTVTIVVVVLHDAEVSFLSKKACDVFLKALPSNGHNCLCR
ncbi:hypothetical protein HZH66_014066 [Vespula vulgaris]|uniref:Uncharacterized protein n=1 Tax=Vespula vulgaris TaxID=7454 RepID=A0A834J6X3_VESVU|nr:hypothetical protein HZH66_014066 [Vespula vulgaris]